MKRIVLIYGLIAGAILSATFLITLPFHDAIGFDHAMVVGYTSMVLAFLLIYFGVRSYRDNVLGGTIRFGRALGTGLLIAAVAGMCYVAMWQVVYYNFIPDYLDKYQAHVLEKARAEGATEEAIARQRAEMEDFARMYQNPAVNAAVTFLEPLPVSLLMALISAGVLSRRRGAGARAA
ncbi:MAG TPA: DUF4199 domain-containing protein [Gemmatimonadaceae bacterium]|nr:DUF4199 domain-containing protein [Gemmatimonadaceae bacterium]